MTPELGAQWRPIETAPRDGSPQWVRRMYDGRVIKEGWAVYDMLADAAPMRQPLGVDPLGRLSPDDYRQEANATKALVSQKRWLNPDRMHAFPTPTHWRPTTPPDLATGPDEGRSD